MGKILILCIEISNAIIQDCFCKQVVVNTHAAIGIHQAEVPVYCQCFLRVCFRSFQEHGVGVKHVSLG